VNLSGSLRHFLAAPFRARTYRSLAYLALAFLLGLAYFVGLTWAEHSVSVFSSP